jgi:hypothetical protein
MRVSRVMEDSVGKWADWGGGEERELLEGTWYAAVDVTY